MFGGISGVVSCFIFTVHHPSLDDTVRFDTRDGEEQGREEVQHFVRSSKGEGERWFNGIDLCYTRSGESVLKKDGSWIDMSDGVRRVKANQTSCNRRRYT